MNTWTCDRCGRLIQCHNHSLLDSFIDLHRCAQATPAAEAVEHLDRVARQKTPPGSFDVFATADNKITLVCPRCKDNLEPAEARDHQCQTEFSRKWTTKQNYDLLQLSESDSEMLKEMAIGI